MAALGKLVSFNKIFIKMNYIQCKMARAGLGWSVKKLGEMANVTLNAVSRYENNKDAYTSTANKLRKALESSNRVRSEGDNGVFVKFDN